MIHADFMGFIGLTDCPGLSDIAFLIDGSGSVAGRDFNAMKVFVTRLVSSLRIGDTRVGTDVYKNTFRGPPQCQCVTTQ